MLNSKLERFIAKRVLIFLLILSILDIVFIDQRWIALAGLLIGGVMSLLRLNTMVKAFSRLLGKATKQEAVTRNVLNYIVNMAAMIVLMVASIKYSLSLFAGVTVGVLLVPAVIFINSFTEALGLTHNNFE